MHETLEALPRLRRPAAANAAEYWFAPDRFAQRCGRLGDRFTVPMPATGPWLCLTDPGDIQRVFTADTDVLRFGAALAKTSPHLLLLGPAGLTNVDGPANAAVDHMVALAADELGGIGIRVNGIRPGIVASELVAGIADPGPVLDDYLACIPLARVGAPADIAEAARFLAGPESAWITGEVINVDGGQHLRRGPDYTAAFEPVFGAAALRGLPEEAP